MIARGTFHWVISSLLLFIISLVLLLYMHFNATNTGQTEFIFGWWLIFFSSLLFLILTIFFLAFFRDPKRLPAAPGITAPADGVVKAVENERYSGEEYTRIVTFMNVHNVHVNRIPLDGTVKSVEKQDGGFLPAYNPGSIKNNRVKIVLKTKIGEVTIYQITGIFARRIVPYLSSGDRVKKGDRLGIIKFGSRVDLLLPSNKVRILAKPGDKPRANLTTMAELK